MKLAHYAALCFALACIAVPSVEAQTIVVNDSAATVTLPPLLAPGGTVSFEGNVDVAGAIAVDFNAVPLDATILFTAPSTTRSDTNEALRITGLFQGVLENQGSLTSDADDTVLINDAFSGSFLNAGSITSLISQGVLLSGTFDGDFTNRGTITAEFEAIDFESDFTGNFLNSGTLTSLSGDGVDFDTGFDGFFTNTGTITAEDETVDVGGDFTGSFTNSGLIESDDEEGVYVSGNFDGTFTNEGSILAYEDGVQINSDFNGSFINRGTIESDDSDGIIIFGSFDGTFLNTATINGYDEAVVFVDDFTGTFTNRGEIYSESGDSVDFGGDFNGAFFNTGTISNDGDDAIDLDGDFTGTFSNSGNILATDESGIDFDGEFTGTFMNSGLIEGYEEAIYFDDYFTGTFINTGTIRSIDDFGIYMYYDFEGTFNNSGTISSVDDAYYNDEGFVGTFINTGTMRSLEDDAVDIADDFVGTFTNSGLLDGGYHGVIFDSGFEGSFTNSGTIIGRGHEAVYVEDDFSGTFVNSGTIFSSADHVVEFDELFTGTFENSGTIRGTAGNAIQVGDTFDGTLTNTGIIESENDSAIVITDTTGTVINRGGRISGAVSSIELGTGNGTVILSGTSSVEGIMKGGDGDGDTLRFENIVGISPEKRAELIALAEAGNPGVTSITLFGETLSWTEFENIQVDAGSLLSFGNLITRPGLENFASTLDNVLGLTDETRNLLNELGSMSSAELNEVAANLSGQTLASGLDDFSRLQDANLFSLFVNEFSTLRRDPSGGGTPLAANERNGLFTREIQVGVTIEEPLEDNSHVFVTGYYGNAEQDSDLTRSASSTDSTSVVFGRTETLSHALQLGIWGGYADNQSTVDSFGSYLRNEAGFVGVNAQYQNDFLFSNLIVGYGFHDQLSTRRDFLGGVHDGDAIGHQALLQAQVGRDFSFGDESQGKISPYLGFTASNLWMGGYTENGPALTRLRFAAEESFSAQSILGVNISTLQETNHGWIKPKLDAAWWHEFAGADNYGVSLATPGFLNAFQVTSPVANRDRAVIQAGLEFGLDRWEGVSFDATYFGTFGGDGYSSHGGALSATFAF